MNPMREGQKPMTTDEILAEARTETEKDKARKPEEIEAAVKKVLQGAIDFLTPRTLTKHNFFIDKDGKTLVLATANEKAVACCVAGAIIAGHGFKYGYDYGRASKAVQAAAGLSTSSSIMGWNDDEKTTKEMVLAALVKAKEEYKYVG